MRQTRIRNPVLGSIIRNAFPDCLFYEIADFAVARREWGEESMGWFKSKIISKITDMWRRFPNFTN